MSKINQKLIAQGARLMLKGMGVNLQDDNFKDTPQRVARLYEELLTPKTNNISTFPSTYNSMVILRGHIVTAICPHHLMPVELRAYVGYVPRKQVLGLSKLARIVEQHLTRPIMQEELADLTADSLLKVCDADSCAVILAGTHGCMRHRGVKTQGDVVASAMRGQFLLNPAAREEFMSIIGRP